MKKKNENKDEYVYVPPAEEKDIEFIPIEKGDWAKIQIRLKIADEMAKCLQLYIDDEEFLGGRKTEELVRRWKEAKNGI